MPSFVPSRPLSTISNPEISTSAWRINGESTSAGQGWDVRVIPDRGVADGLNRYDTLVLPAATVLSDDQTRAIKQFLREGNGVILTWATGTRDENGQWRDFPLLAEVCGMKYLGEVEPLIAADLDQPSTRDLIFASPSPITANIPPGLRLPVNLYDNPIGMEPVEPRITVDATWPLDQHGADVPPTAAAVVHGEYLGGRFVWMSFTFGSPMGSPRTETYYPELLNNAVAWVSKQPIAFKPIWPSDYESAMLVSHATYNDFSNIPDFLALLQRNSIRGTLYCGSDQAGLYPDSLRSFAETANEVASMGDTLSSFVGTVGIDAKHASGQLQADLRGTDQPHRLRIPAPGRPVGGGHGQGIAQSRLPLCRADQS
ncbi:MAG: beta-galactosidase trimerization domain-containing protein [Verrucomicrobiota bacterium]